MPSLFGGTRARSCAPCTTKRPAGTGTRSSRLALTQSLASTVSKAMVPAISSLPASVRPLERRDRRLALEEDVGEHVDHALGGVFVADREMRAVGGGGEGGG